MALPTSPPPSFLLSGNLTSHPPHPRRPGGHQGYTHPCPVSLHSPPACAHWTEGGSPGTLRSTPPGPSGLRKAPPRRSRRLRYDQQISRIIPWPWGRASTCKPRGQHARPPGHLTPPKEALGAQPCTTVPLQPLTCRKELLPAPLEAGCCWFLETLRFPGC